MKLNLNDRVRIYNVPMDGVLYNKTGTILGCSYGSDNEIPGFSAYIVLLDEPLPSHRAVSITNACLKLMDCD